MLGSFVCSFVCLFVCLSRWDERFVGYGYDKVSHTTALSIARYTFYVLPDVFIIHAEHGVPGWRGKGDLVCLQARWSSSFLRTDAQLNNRFVLITNR